MASASTDLARSTSPQMGERSVPSPLERPGSFPLRVAPGALDSLEPSSADARCIAELIARGEAGPVRFAGVYVHVPFCFHKCHYCDFYSLVDSNGREGAFVDRLLDEAKAWAGLDWAALRPSNGGRDGLETLFVGGGTPTLLEPALLRRLLHGLRSAFPWASDAEWTVEANPETVTEAVAQALAESGVNRVSIGCQSFDPLLLQALERWHDPSSVPRAVELLRREGIGNINLDLIFGVPGESIQQWQADLERALELRPAHLSCYGLVYEPNTALTRRRDLGGVVPVEEELEAAMYELARQRLAAAGYEQYEISNWARPGRRCRHNDLYWTDADWIALGPSASGHAGLLRWKNVARLGAWLASGPFSSLAHAERLSQRQRSGERFMLGLRRVEGIPLEQVEALLSCGDAAIRRAAIERGCSSGLLEWQAGRLRFTSAGLLVADSVLASLI